MKRIKDMTERGWEVCVNPFRMLQCLLGIGKASDRKLLLFAAASARRVWHDLSDEERFAIEAAEGYAEGEAAWADLERVAFPTSGPYHWDKDPLINFVVAVATKATKRATEKAYGRVWESFERGDGAQERQRIVEDLGLPEHCASDPREASVAIEARERNAQESIIRDIFGNPFCPAPVVDPSWLMWGGGTVSELAEVIDNERDFSRMRELAQVLESAGCTDGEILHHLRRSGPHFRGCLVLDVVLNKPTLPRG
jgi:hypothetical protein